MNTLLSLPEIAKDIQDYYNNHGAGAGLTTGWSTLDNLLKLRKGALHIITGIPSSGKSEWLDQLMLQTIALHNWHWSVFSPENWPLPYHFQKLSEKWVGKPMWKHGLLEDSMTPDELSGAIKDLTQYITFLNPPQESLHIEPILNLVLQAHREHATDAFILDPYNELEHQRPENMTETEYIGHTLTRIRNFGRMNDIAMFIVAHPTKLQKQEDGNYPVPTPYDISGSANWRNKADVCISIWRDYGLNDGVVDVHIQKVRNKNLGQLGESKLYWNFKNGIFWDSPELKQSLKQSGIREMVQGE